MWQCYISLAKSNITVAVTIRYININFNITGCSAGTVRHQIFTDQNMILWSDFRAWKEPFSAVYMVKR